jgi:hypothetical protein
MIYKPLISLLYSRKFLLAMFGVAQSIILHYADVPPEIWGAIDILVVTLIGSIAHEDAAEKGAAKAGPVAIAADNVDVEAGD